MSKPQIVSVESEAYHQLSVRQVAERLRGEGPKSCLVAEQAPRAQVTSGDEHVVPTLELVPEHLF